MSSRSKSNSIKKMMKTSLISLKINNRIRNSKTSLPHFKTLVDSLSKAKIIKASKLMIRNKKIANIKKILKAKIKMANLIKTLAMKQI